METKKDEVKFEVVKWNAVAVWNWQCTCCFSNCAICRNSYLGPCVECEANSETGTLDCPVSWGVCNHAFHSHCINRWVYCHGRPFCPLDNRTWEEQNFWLQACFYQVINLLTTKQLSSKQIPYSSPYSNRKSRSYSK